MGSNSELLEGKRRRIAWLVAGFIRNTLTETEHDELDDWINESDHNMQLFEEWTDEDHLSANLQWMDANSYKDNGRVQTVSIFKYQLFKWTATIAVLLLLIITTCHYLPKQSTETPNSIKSSIKASNNQSTLVSPFIFYADG